MDVSEYATLLSDVKAVSAELQLDKEALEGEERPYFALFSRSGFTQRLEEMVANGEAGRLLLFSLSALFTV